MDFFGLLERRRNRRRQAREKALEGFRRRYVSFLELLESNSNLLGIIGDMEEKLRGDELFGMSYVRSRATRALFHAQRMARSYDVLSGGMGGAVLDALEGIRGRILALLEDKVGEEPTELVLPFERAGKDMLDFVGGKSAHLGEMVRAGTPVPPGFAVTTAAFRALLAAPLPGGGELRAEIRRHLLAVDPARPQSVNEAADEIAALFAQVPLPARIAESLDRACAELESTTGGPVLLAFRSSAVGEDSELSFAGQYLTLLGVRREDAGRAWLRVAASLFSPHALTYRLHKGVPFEDTAMAVACLVMVPSVCSGVLYTRHPYEPLDPRLRVDGVWGLGPYAVDGVVEPDAWLVERDPLRVSEFAAGDKHARLVLGPDGAPQEESVSGEERLRPCLENSVVLELCRLGLELERRFGAPQDIEWAMHPDGRILILQSRPLRAGGGGMAASPPVPGREVLLSGGRTACPGVGCGVVRRVREGDDLLDFPEGGVLVAERSSPGYVLVFQRAQAVVTDAGSVTGHMASLCREFDLPAVLGMKGAVRTLRDGMEVTVDAFSGRVYAGRVDELLALRRERAVLMTGSPVHETLRALAELITPLHLTNPKAPEFGPQGCTSLHDVMRLIHERSYERMFLVSDQASDVSGLSVKLAAQLPLDLHVIDLGGGLDDPDVSDVVTVEQVTSAPFKALLAGMLDGNLRGGEPRPVSLSGFLSVMSSQLLTPPEAGGQRFGDRSYAIVSDKYLNFSSRVGYHYSILDAYAGQNVNKNYVSFEFKGGAAAEELRVRRVRAIARILGVLGFVTETRGDRVVARLLKRERGEILDRLEAVGRLLIFTRQMDMLMTSEARVDLLAESFLNGDYHCSGLRGPCPEERPGGES
ncbi:PEP/pyruvate-binding domain-containing protein [Paucidesulfovibrio longus]|uniref:PEP/pyruvate-binding domain-containing protein n=1 Tax=Paucidesulfovibrio longus TaxID=889 RepID=UPI0003B3161B|nr:PEP/pyruvate-binding domain-containing protein [Paucidesulfovibrio longus]